MIRFLHVFLFSVLFAIISPIHADTLPGTGQIEDLLSPSHRIPDATVSATPPKCECSEATFILKSGSPQGYIANCKCGDVYCIAAITKNTNSASSALQCYK